MRELFSKDLASLILRLVFGFSLFYGHGLGKFKRLLEGDMKFGDPLGIGQELSFFLVVFAEFLCSILVAVGLLTRITVIPLIFTMIVAAFVVHIDDPFRDMEMAILYLGAFISIFILGSGRYSLDHLFSGRKK